MWETLGTILGGGVLGGILTAVFSFLRNRSKDAHDQERENLQYLFENYQRQQDERKTELAEWKSENREIRREVIKMQNLYITAKAEHEHALGLLADCEKQHAETKREMATMQRRLETVEKQCRGDKGEP